MLQSVNEDFKAIVVEIFLNTIHEVKTLRVICRIGKKMRSIEWLL